VIGLLISLIVVGLIVGALGRLAIPGPNPMTIPMTIGVGVAASLIAGLIGRAIFGGNGGGLILAVLVAAGIVWLMQRNTRRGGFVRR
jgi:uncharacterized membrane protein YeaQ/YmgE (transglycosylase-associated protein family)